MHLVKPPPCKDLKECVGETQSEVWKDEEAKQGTNDMSATKHSQQDSTQAQNCVNDIHNPSSMPIICAHNVVKDCVDTSGMNIESISFSCKCFICLHSPRLCPTYKSYLYDVEGHLSFARALICICENLYYVILSFPITSSHNSNLYSVVINDLVVECNCLIVYELGFCNNLLCSEKKFVARI